MSTGRNGGEAGWPRARMPTRRRPLPPQRPQWRRGRVASRTTPEGSGLSGVDVPQWRRGRVASRTRVATADCGRGRIAAMEARPGGLAHTVDRFWPIQEAKLPQWRRGRVASRTGRPSQRPASSTRRRNGGEAGWPRAPHRGSGHRGQRAWPQWRRGRVASRTGLTETMRAKPSVAAMEARPGGLAHMMSPFTMRPAGTPQWRRGRVASRTLDLVGELDAGVAAAMEARPGGLAHKCP